MAQYCTVAYKIGFPSALPHLPEGAKRDIM
jgi:hypothetical protein